MSLAGGAPGFRAIAALVAARGDFPAIADKDWAAASGLIVRKLLVSGGQTEASLLTLRNAVGADIFEGQLKTLSHHQARLLARRLDKAVPDLDVSTARAAIAWIQARLVAPPADSPPADQPLTDETPAAAETETAEAASPNPYFGRKSFRTD